MADGRRKNSKGQDEVLVNGKWVLKDKKNPAPSKTDPAKGSGKGTSSGTNIKPNISKGDQDRVGEFKGYVNAGKEVADDILGKGFGFERVTDQLPTDGPYSSIVKAASDAYTGAGKNTTGQDEALGILRNNALHAGDRSSDSQHTIDTARELLDNAGTMDPRVSEALDKMKSGLGGLTTDENTALYESLLRDSKNTMQSQGRQAAITNAGAGLTNPALTRSLAQDYLRAKMGASQEVLYKNADVQNTRLNDYGTFAEKVQEALFGQKKDATTLYGNAVSGIEGDEFNRKLASSQAYNSGVEANVNNNRQDTINRLQQWSQGVTQARNDQINKINLNNNSLASEISTKTGIVLGVPAYIMGDKASDEANKIAADSIKAAGGGGSSGDGRTNTGDGRTAPTVLANDSFDAPRSGGSVGATVTGTTPGRL